MDKFIGCSGLSNPLPDGKDLCQCHLWGNFPFIPGTGLLVGITCNTEVAMHNKITIKDIAREAGVGISTVSRVLNGYPLVKEETRTRVLDICNKRNFIPNGAARMLVKKSGQENTIAIVMSEIAHQFFFELISSMQANMRNAGFHAMIFNTDQGRESVIQYIIELGISAVIIMGTPQISDADKELLRLYRVPLLYIDRHDKDSNFITYSNHHGGRLAASYLAEKGATQVMLVGLTDRSEPQVDRFEGFLAYLKEANLTMRTQEVLVSDEQGAYTLAKSLMLDQSIDGYFFFIDTMAMAGKQAARDLNRNVPIIGYDDIFPARFMNLTTVRQSVAVLGEKTVGIIKTLITEHPEHLIQEILTPELIIRD